LWEASRKEVRMAKGCLCLCVCACVCACVRNCVCERERVCALVNACMRCACVRMRFHASASDLTLACVRAPRCSFLHGLQFLVGFDMPDPVDPHTPHPAGPERRNRAAGHPTCNAEARIQCSSSSCGDRQTRCAGRNKSAPMPASDQLQLAMKCDLCGKSVARLQPPNPQPPSCELSREAVAGLRGRFPDAACADQKCILRLGCARLGR
jgi:hypothetical protein